MQVIHGTLDAPLCVTGSLAIHGTVGGVVRVMPTGELVLRGVCKGSIVVAAGARAEIWGIVEGNIINQGGDLYIAGLVEGYVDRAEGRTTTAPDFRARRGYC